nr:hypothetical protein [Tanacetum cinerariifolium]
GNRVERSYSSSQRRGSSLLLNHNGKARRYNQLMFPSTSKRIFQGFPKKNFTGQVNGEAKLKEQFVEMKDVAVQRLVDCSSVLDARLSELCYQVDFKLYPHMLTAVASHRWVIGHSLKLAFMKCCRSVDYQTSLGKVISLAIDQGIQQGLEAGIDHDKPGKDLSTVVAYNPRVKACYKKAIGELENISLPFLARLESYKDASLDRVMVSLYLEGFPNVEDETPNFRKLQPVLEQVTIPIYYERGGSHVPGTVYREVLFGEALEDSLARAWKHKLVVSSSLTIMVQEQGTSSSLATAVTPLNSITANDYTIIDVSMLKVFYEF